MSSFRHIDQLTSVLSFHRSRHTVIAGNVANVDTPGYRPVDLARQQPFNQVLPQAQTRAGHLAGVGGQAGGAVFEDSSAMVGADGNAVNLERELAKIDANRVRYGAVSEVISRRLAMLRYAATDGNG